MKKIIKILLLMLFIIFVFGITTSQAELVVNENTTAEEMITELKNGGYLTGISNYIRKKNPALYCKQHGMAIYRDAQYKLESEKKYPEFDEDGNVLNNGYAVAYVLAAPGYSKINVDGENGDRQYALWSVLGQASEQEKEKTVLDDIALKYQNFKNNEKNVNTVTNNATTSIIENNIVYGPIQITYSYLGGSVGEKSYSFGGFNYKLSDSSAKLCVKNSDNTFSTISSTDTNSDGYLEVRTSAYNNQNLYILISSKNISEVTLQIQENSVDYTATIYDMKGTHKTEYEVMNLCQTCQDNVVEYELDTSDGNAILSPTEPTQVLKKGSIIHYLDGDSYKYYEVNDVEITESFSINDYVTRRNKLFARPNF